MSKKKTKKGTAVVQAGYAAAPLEARMAYAERLCSAGDLIPRGLHDPATGRPSPGKVLLVIETGAALGLDPTAALQGINVIEGKATMSAQLMTALVRRAGHRLTIQQTGSIPGGDFSACVTLTRVDDGSVFTATWDIPRALRASLVDSFKQEQDGSWRVVATSRSGKPLPWQMFPESMCTWRAVSEVCRLGADDVLKGVTHTPEELESTVSVMESPEPDSSEEWEKRFTAAVTVDELNQVADELREAGEGTPKLRRVFASRLGTLQAAEQVVDAEVVEPGTEAEDAGVEPQGATPVALLHESEIL